MTKIDEVDVPIVVQVERIIKDNPDEVFRPKEITDRFDNISDYSVRSALHSLQSQDKEISRVKLSQRASYYGTTEAVERLKERVGVD